MIYGSGDLNITVNSENLGRVFIPACASLFSLTSSTDYQSLSYLSSDGVVKTREAGITEEDYIVELEIQDFDYTAMMYALGEFAFFSNSETEADHLILCPLTSVNFTDPRITSFASVFVYNQTETRIMYKQTDPPTESNQVQVDVENQLLVFHPDQVGQAVEIVLTNTGLTRGVIGDQQVFETIDNISFQGTFFTTNGDGPYTVLIPKLERITGSEVSTSGDAVIVNYRAIKTDTDNDRKPFRIYPGADFPAPIDPAPDVLTVEILLAPLPVVWTPGSVVNIAGSVILTNNPGGDPVESINFTSFFDFASPGNETINFTTDPAGNFSIMYTVDPALAFPDSGFYRITVDATGQVPIEQAVGTPAPVPPPVLSAAFAGAEFQNTFVSISGASTPGSTVTVNTANMAGLFDSTMYVADLGGSWTTGSAQLDISVLGGTTISATVTNSVGDPPVNIMTTLGIRVFAPVVNHVGNFGTGFPVTLQNTATVIPNTDISIQIESPDLVFVTTQVTADNAGSFSLIYTIPLTEQGKTLTYTFTEV